MNEVAVGRNRIRCWPSERHVCTILPDGSEVPARPNDTPADVARAYELGYDGDTLAMTIAHESLHTYLADAAGLPYSPALWWVAHRGLMTDEMARGYAAEEATVLYYQRLANVVGCLPDWLDDPLLPGARALIAALMEDA